MSEPKMISPMLDDFEMGIPISDHDGVRCCPAMRKNSDDKYIVKIISVPASQTQMDALLLTGAYPNKNAALQYFKSQAEGIADEKRILDNLAKMEGFLPFVDCQIVPMDDGNGYDVYLLSEYRVALDRHISTTPMTQLSAVNLGLDLCAALAVCRRSGYMCVDLKPSNIFVVGDKEYRIGDLGFVRLNSLKYESMPDKYRSCYTAPEVEDAFAVLSDTMDIYSAGLILYQIFNGGTLPFSGNQAPNMQLDPPAFADEEMSQIILKACNPNPFLRWSDPIQMGQAIVNYMQKNGANDTPLVEEPAVPDIAEAILFVSEEDMHIDDTDVQLTVDESVSIEAVADSHEVICDTKDTPEESTVELPSSEYTNGIDDEETVVDNQIPDDSSVVNDAAEDTKEELAEIVEIENISIAAIIEASEAAAEEICGSIISDDSVTPDPEEYDNLSFLDDLAEVEDGIVDDFDENYDCVSQELSEMLDQIDDLAAHHVPDPVVAPEPIEIVIPESVQNDCDEVCDNSNNIEAESEEDDISEITEDQEAIAEDIPEEEQPYVPKKKRTGLIWTIVLILIIALGVGGYFFYTQYYLQQIHALSLSGTEDSLQVRISADIDETLLTVVCADSHGNKVTAPVADSMAVFTGLSADTAYTVTIEIDGFHELTGMTSKVYSTPLETKIVQSSVITGSESGSVVLSFAVEGPDSDQWNVIYNAEDEAERVTAFPAHTVTLTGLTVGKEYTFRLEPSDDIYISGETEIKYVVQNLICAEHLNVTACADGELTVQWDTPAGETVTEWIVHCYNATGYDEIITTADNTVTFQNVDDSVENTVEVTAAGMSVHQSVLVSANSVTVSKFSVDSSKPDVLSLSWKANRDIPAEGWTIRYGVNGVIAPTAVLTKENAAEIPVVPSGSYVFAILDGAGNAVLGGPFTHEQPAATAFDAYDVKQENLTVRLCKTPSAASWSYKDLKDEDYVNTFSSGEKISMVFACSGNVKKSDDNILITYAVYDEDNNLVSFSHDSMTWQSMWYQNYCELDLLSAPTEVGTYNLIVYFNGANAGSQKFEIT